MEPERRTRLSHIVTIHTKALDRTAIDAACQRLGLPAVTQGTAKLYSGEATGLLLQLPKWTYPAVIDTTTGDIRFDNYNGAWGDQGHLDQFLQMYAVERAKLEARKKGFTATEQTLQDGSIKIQIFEGAA
jgi:hypothetical protein